MDYGIPSEYSVARRVLSSLENLGVELSVQNGAQSIVALSNYGSAGGEHPFGVVMGDDTTDIILVMRGIDAILRLAETDSDVAFALMNEINLYLGESFGYSGTLFVQDGNAQIHYFISHNDHKLQEQMNECVSQAAQFADEVSLIAEGNRPLSSLGANDKDCFSGAPEKTLSKPEVPKPPSARKEGFLGRLFSR